MAGKPDIHDSVSGTNLDDELQIYSMLAVDSQGIENQGDYDPLGYRLPLQNFEGTSASTSLMEANWDGLHDTAQPGINNNHFWPTAVSEGNTNLESARNRQEEIHNQETDNLMKYLPSCDSPMFSLEHDGDDAMLSESCGDEIQYEPVLNSKEVNSHCPEIGMEFSSEEEAHNFYSAHAKETGFKVRRGKIRLLSDGTIRTKRFVCSCEGFRVQKQTNKTTRSQRKETRTGCEAMVQFTIENGKWVISCFNPGHNHDLQGKSKIKVGLSNNVSQDPSMSITMNEAGIVKEAGTANSVGSHNMDCASFFQDETMNCPQLVDGQSLINNFRHMQVEDPSFLYTVQVNAKNCLTNFFWTDGRSKIDYDYFGDVLIVDTTFRIYNIICAPLLGINHHGQYILFGGAFLLDNNTDSFIWLFSTFLESMGSHKPKTIFTNGCQAMADAIEVVLPKTQHLLGPWYILQNTAKHLSSYYGEPDFDSLFKKCIFNCESEEEFESMWGSLLEQYNLFENSWLKDLYTMRRKWSHYSCMGIFSAGIRSTQGYESICKIFHSLTGEAMHPLQFVQQYLKVAEQQRREELYEDFRCNGSAAAIILRSNAMEKEAEKIYTCTMFKLFQEELLECLSVAVEEIPSDGMTTRFKLTEGGHKKEKIVEFNSLESHVTCSCKKYESVGILCVHALRVLNTRNTFNIPPQYILKRWTKSAKDGTVVDGHEGGEVAVESHRHFLLPKSKLMHNALNVITKSLATEETRMIVDDHLKMALKKVEDVLRTKNIEDVNTAGIDVQCKDDAGSAYHFGCVGTQQIIADPSTINQLEVSKTRTTNHLKRKHEKEVRELNCKFSDGVIAHHHPLKAVTKGGDYQGSRKGASHSYCIGENFRQSACKSPRPPLPSQSTFHSITEPSKSMGTIQETKKQALHLMSRRHAAEKQIMVRMEELQKEIMKFRYENQKIFSSWKKNSKLISQEKLALQHQFKGTGGANSEAPETGSTPIRSECQAQQTEQLKILEGDLI